MRRGDVYMSGYVAVVCAAMGIIFWLVLGPHGGDYVNARFHFEVRYPSGWQANESLVSSPTASLPPTQTSGNAPTGNPQSAPVPLVLTIRQAGASGSLATSSFTVTIWDLSNPIAAVQAQILAHNASLHATTISGLSGFVSSPTRQVRYFDTAIPTPDSSPDAFASPSVAPSPQPSPGTQCTLGHGTPCTIITVVVTHTDYYVVHGDFEYQLTTDAISGERTDSALQGMVASFRLTA
jgi:hypothetical protein